MFIVNQKGMTCSEPRHYIRDNDTFIYNKSLW